MLQKWGSMTGDTSAKVYIYNFRSRRECFISLYWTYKDLSSVTFFPQGQRNTGLEGVTLRWQISKRWQISWHHCDKNRRQQKPRHWTL